MCAVNGMQMPQLKKGMNESTMYALRGALESEYAQHIQYVVTSM